MKRFITTALMVLTVVFAMLAGDTYALITGCSSYNDPRNNTHQTTEDAKQFRKIMRNATSNITLLTSENATSTSTLDKLRKFAAGTKAGDRIVFFYSGHGSSASEGKAGLFMSDGQVLPYSSILKALNASKAKEKIIILNCCYSGGIKAEMDKLGITDIIVIASSRADEVTYENTIIGGCFFTNSLKAALMGKADFNKDRKVTLDEAFRYVHKDVVKKTTNSKNAQPQHPTLVAPKAMKDIVLMDWTGK
jgi:Uncharacterized protein containing caspase domain